MELFGGGILCGEHGGRQRRGQSVRVLVLVACLGGSPDVRALGRRGRDDVGGREARGGVRGRPRSLQLPLPKLSLGSPLARLSLRAGHRPRSLASLRLQTSLRGLRADLEVVGSRGSFLRRRRLGSRRGQSRLRNRLSLPRRRLPLCHRSSRRKRLLERIRRRRRRAPVLRALRLGLGEEPRELRARFGRDREPLLQSPDPRLRSRRSLSLGSRHSRHVPLRNTLHRGEYLAGGPLLLVHGRFGGVRALQRLRRSLVHLVGEVLSLGRPLSRGGDLSLGGFRSFGRLVPRELSLVGPSPEVVDELGNLRRRPGHGVLGVRRLPLLQRGLRGGGASLGGGGAIVSLLRGSLRGGGPLIRLLPPTDRFVPRRLGVLELGLRVVDACLGLVCLARGGHGSVARGGGVPRGGHPRRVSLRQAPPDLRQLSLRGG